MSRKRQRIAGALTACGVYVPWLVSDKVFPLDWHWPGPMVLNYGVLLSVLPGLILTATLAPRVGYRRRDALLVLLPPWGLRVAWVVGTRLGQLPHRDWPERTETFPVQNRYTARIAAAAHSRAQR